MLLEHLRDRIQGKAKKGEKRDPAWKDVRRQFLLEHPRCASCGSKRKVQAHHIIPFQYAPDLELEFDNLLTLCTGGRFRGLNCHFIVGHLGDFRRVNEMVEADAAEWSIKLRKRRS